jgi:hypothetical protein
MPYTVWKNGEKIGETRFELSPGPRKRAGVFHPTALGLTVLPGITAMAPALLEFGVMCQERGVDINDSRREVAERALDEYSDTPQAKRIQLAAGHIADLELRDSTGKTLEWESIMISDMTTLVELAARRQPSARDQLKTLPGDPIRFMISTTLAPPHTPPHPNPLSTSEWVGVC